MIYNYLFRVWVLLYVSLIVCKRIHDTEVIPTIIYKKKKKKHRNKPQRVALRVDLVSSVPSVSHVAIPWQDKERITFLRTIAYTEDLLVLWSPAANTLFILI